MSIKRETVAERKALPLATGVLDYFPDALLAVAEVSRVGNEQHHPGEPLHWDKSKSTDEADALLRHLLDRGTYDVDGMRHSAKVAWRALALLQRELDAETLVATPPPSDTDMEHKPVFNEPWRARVGMAPGVARHEGEVLPEPAIDVRTRFMCGHYFGEEPITEGPNLCGRLIHWSRVNGVEQVPSIEFRQVGTEAVPAGVAVCEDSGNHIPGRHLLECPDYS